jgi:flagellar basal-body rod protein FlgB
LRATRAGHFFPGERTSSTLNLDVVDRPSGGSPNGNTVSIEMEMLESIEADRTHNRAVTIYETALGILRTSMRSGR